jgi:hypothetical protein
MSGESEVESEARAASTLSWILKSAIRLVLLALLILLLAVIIGFGLILADQRMNAINRRVDLVHDDLGSLLEDEASQREQLVQAQATADAQSRMLAGQRDSLVTLEDETTVLNANSETMSQTIDLLLPELDAQGDNLENNNRRIEQLGLDVGSLGEDIDGLGFRADELELLVIARDEEVARLQQSLSLMNLWQLVTGARLRLAEDNPGLALADVERAILVAGALDERGAESDELLTILQRLELALDSLPDEPAIAARDL